MGAKGGRWRTDDPWAHSLICSADVTKSTKPGDTLKKPAFFIGRSTRSEEKWDRAVRFGEKSLMLFDLLCWLKSVNM
jgi:hypothetical protein